MRIPGHGLIAHDSLLWHFLRKDCNRDEGQDEHDGGHNSPDHAGEADWFVIIHSGRMPEAGKQFQHKKHSAEEKPLKSRHGRAREAICCKAEQASPKEPGNFVRVSSKQRIRNMSAIELRNGNQIQTCREARKPGCKSNWMKHSIHRIRREELKNQRITQIKLSRRSGSLWDQRTPMNPQIYKRKRYEKTGQRSSDSNIKKGATVRKGSANADQSAKSACSNNRCRQKERQGRIDTVVTTGQIMPHFVAQQYEHDRKGVADSFVKQCRICKDLLQKSNGVRRRSAGFVEKHPVGPPEKRGENGQQEERSVKKIALRWRRRIINRSRKNPFRHRN